MQKKLFISVAFLAASCFAGGSSYTMEKLADTSAAFTSAVEYPVFRDYPELNKIITHKVKENYASIKTQYSSDWKGMDSIRRGAGDTTVTPSFEYKITCDTLFENDKNVSLFFTFYDWTGGAHGNIALVSIVYDKKQKRSLSITEASGLSLQKISDICRKDLLKTLCGGNLKDTACVDWVKNGSAPKAENYSAFTSDGKTLIIYFAPYQVAPWAAGIVTVKISLR